MLFFISNAYADGGAQAGGLMSFLPVIAFVAVLYFLLIRPQQKRQKQHQAMIAAIKKGDKVVTNSGIIATVSKILSEQEVVLEIAAGVHCKFVKSAISSVLNVSASTPIAASTPKVETPSVASSENSEKKIEAETPSVEDKSEDASGSKPAASTRTRSAAAKRRIASKILKK
jgi:preprotein translocase subunit YajC